MKKKGRWKAAIYCLFVLFAGIAYACSTKGGQAVLEQDREDSPTVRGESENDSEGEHIQTKTDFSEDKSLSDDRVLYFYVHVCGAVEQPGGYYLSENSRESDAIAAAGGLTADAAGDYLNQARKVVDGERVYIPNKKEAEELAAAGKDPIVVLEKSSLQNETAADGKININTATKEQLMQLSGIGATRADAIIAYREKQGGFKTCKDLMNVDGIKESVYNKICEDIAVEG